ncbi:MAG: hypothetical protein KF773_13360 [Deltaproteobacteria bacterium]|nr:hypothetical protein [Deltaproteobacteria bacterium]
MRRAWIAIAAAAVAILGVLALRVVVEGRAALADGDEAMAQRRPAAAIEAWERAARWYLPGAPHVDDAYDRLVRIARTDPRHALTSWRAVRSAALATRGLWTPHGDDLAEADAAIAKISSEDPEAAPLAGAKRLPPYDDPGGAGTDDASSGRPTGATGADAAARLAFHRDRLARPVGPSGGAIALAVAGIVAWLGGLAWLVGSGARRRPISGAVVAAIGVAVWAVGLYKA